MDLERECIGSVGQGMHYVCMCWVGNALREVMMGVMEEGLIMGLERGTLESGGNGGLGREKGSMAM